MEGGHLSRDIAPDVSDVSASSSNISSNSSLAQNAESNETEKSSQPGSLNRRLTEDEIMRVLSRRRTGESEEDTEGGTEAMAQIMRLVSRMFGDERKTNSDEEKTRHLGVVWKHLTVKGVGLVSNLSLSALKKGQSSYMT